MRSNRIGPWTSFLAPTSSPARRGMRISSRIGGIAGMMGLVAVASAVAVPAAAQRTGSIHGVVSGADDHAPLAGARVSIATPARVSITDEQGAYVLRELPAGSYVVIATATGRAPDSSRVTIAAGASVSLDLSLKQGSLLLSSVVVSATRTPVEASKLTSTVDVLTPEQVRQTPSREAQDMLREIPAVELPRTSSLVGGTAQIVSIRGVDEGRTAVLFDGIPVNDAWGEWIDWGRVPKSMLDRVEVVEGGQSSLYGNGAMGGLISFFSRPMAPGAMDIQLDGGSRDARHVYAAAGVPVLGPLTAQVNGDYQEGGGYRLVGAGGGPIDVASNVIQRNGYVRLDYAPSSNWSAFATGHLFGDSRGLGTPLTTANRDQRNVDLGFTGNAAGGALAIRAWDGRLLENQRASAIRATPARTAEDSSLTAQIPSHDWGASAQWTWQGALHLESLGAGGDLRHYQGDFNEVDFATAGCPASPTCGSISQRVSSGGNQTLSGAFVQAIAAPVAPLRIEASARVDAWDNDDGHSLVSGGAAATYPNEHKTAFSPRLGARYDLFKGFSLHGAVYKAFRAPNLAELYRKQVSPTSITVPNPNLSPETALGREAGFDWQPVDWIQFKGTWYVAEYNDFNVPTNLTATTTPPRPAECGTVGTCRTRLNVSRSRSQGGEAFLALRPVRQLYVTAGVNYDDDRQQSGLPAGTLDDHKPHINRVPSPRQTVRATWSSPLLGDWTAIWRHEGHTTTLQGVWLDPFTVVDLNVQRDLTRGLRGFASLENAGNTTYQVNISGPVVSVGMPRTLRIGIEAYR